MIVLLIAGIGVILAGLVAVGLGIPVKEFGFGNTLILTGTIGVCTGLLILSLVVFLRELKAMAAGGSWAHQPGAPRIRRELPQLGADPAAVQPDVSPLPGGPLFGRDQVRADRAASETSPPWQDEAPRDRDHVHNAPDQTEAPDEDETPQPKRRNLLFSSTRRERERAEAKEAEDAQASRDTVEPASRPFDAAWPQSESKPRPDIPRRPARPAAPVTDPEPAAAEVSVLKSGVVDGMAYSLYSDGSIEAQMPEGMMRFASIDELREHLDQRGS